MKTNEKLPELIDRYTQGDLAGTELEEFMALYDRSVRLREEIRLNKELDEVLARADILDLRKKINFEKNRRTRPDYLPFLWAAVALILVGIEIILMLSIPKSKTGTDLHSNLVQRPGLSKPELKTNKGPVSLNPPATATKPHTRLQAAADLPYSANPAFEKLIGATRQSTGFRLQSPETGMNFFGPCIIAFRWVDEEPSDIRLQILDNQGIVALDSGTINGAAFIVPSTRLAKGIYYFRILQDEDIMYFGKFNVY
jgi:hypothetical protein